MDRNHEIWDTYTHTYVVKSGQHYVKASDWRYLSDLSGETPFGEVHGERLTNWMHPIYYYWHHLRFLHPERIRSYSRWISQIRTWHKVTHTETATSGDDCRTERRAVDCCSIQTTCATYVCIWFKRCKEWEKQQITCLDEDAIATRALFVWYVCSEYSENYLMKMSACTPPPCVKMNWSTKKR